MSGEAALCLALLIGFPQGSEARFELSLALGGCANEK